MGPIILGKDLSVYVARSIALGISKKENRDGQKSKYVKIQLVDVIAPNEDPSVVMLFVKDDPTDGNNEVYNELKKYATLDATTNTGVVNLAKFKAESDMSIYGWLIQWDGGMTIDYKFRKGRCIMNDIDGNPVTNKKGQQIIRDSATIFVQVKKMIPDPENPEKMKTIYAKGYEPWTVGPRWEDTFFSQAEQVVDIAPITVTAVEHETSASTPPPVTGDPF